MKAVILAAGKGTRMGELTAKLPKPMVLVKGTPVLEHILGGLRDHGNIRDFFIVIGWYGQVIQDHFGNGEKFGVNITYGSQAVQDGTGKAPEIAKDWLGSHPFLLTYGDILIQPPHDYERLVTTFHKGLPDGLAGVIAVKDGEDLRKGGAVILNSQDEMIDLVEKGGFTETPPNAYYNAGIYLLTADIFAHTAVLEKSPRGEYEFTDALKGIMKAGGRLRGVRLQTKWADVRDPGILEGLNDAPPA
jgi:NDP-sugar pyrophosphorylase family protein